MIDPTTFATLTRILEEHGFTSVGEKLLALILANVSQIQQCDIIQGLALHSTHCREILKNFAEKGLIDTFGKDTKDEPG